MMRRALAASLLAGLLAGGCVDTTPVLVKEGLRDAAAPLPDSAAGRACRQCVMGDGAPCRATFDLCQTLPACPEFTECVFQLGCFAFPLLEDRLQCGGPCIAEIGLTSTHPALPGILAINTCTQEACRDACVIE